MAKFEKAYSKTLDKEVEAGEYKRCGINETDDLECIECRKLTADKPAILHTKQRVSKSGTTIFYATNPKSPHHKECSHFAQFTDEEIIQLLTLETPTPEQLRAKDDLIRQALEAGIRKHSIKPKDKSGEDNLSKDVDAPSESKSHKKGVQGNKKKLYIEPMAISKIDNDADCFDRLVRIHGKVIINVENDIKTINHGGVEKSFTNKIIKFLKKDGKVIFSTYIGEYDANYFGVDPTEEGDFSAIFSGVGKLVIKPINGYDFINFESFIHKYLTRREFIFKDLLKVGNVGSK
ncbi:MAG: hypothetical protein K2X04_04880 [Burkholderiales bacterium]|nr:hypothetical protein [Burkholderiales bacterium]